MKIILYALISFCLLALNSCTRDEINVPINIITISSKGAYVISEGGFNPGTSKLSYYNKTSDSFNVSIFNPGSLGLLPDGILYDNGNLYISEQGNFNSSGKLYKTDTNGTVLMSRSAGINPYSMTISYNKIYLTNGPTNSVTVIDKNTMNLVATVNVGLYPQEILSIGNRVFVCNTNVFNGGTDSTVSVIDAVTDNVINNIVVSKNPSSLAVSADGNLLVGCPGDSSKAVIYKIDPVALIIINSYNNLKYGFSRDIVTTGDNEIIYIAGDIYSEQNIVRYSLSSRTSISLIPAPAGALNYGLGYDSEDSRIYVCVAASDFTSNGKFRIYGSTGTLLKEFTITGGITPRRTALKK
ncbi:MAG: YncE family protein [Bacteroidetes bacterium]|nr:YncE family protein [Bacteroidota bacterium]